MPLQIRRGTDAERTDSTFTPAEGELIYTTDTKKLYVGDGVTPGGVAIDTVGDDSTSSGVGGATVLDDLSDVVITSSDLGPGDVLTYDGVNWSASSIAGISSLDNLSDVVIENPVSGSVLKYDGVNWSVGVDDSGVSFLDDLSDVVIETPVSGSVLKYDGVNWSAGVDDSGVSFLDDLSDVFIENPVSGSVLTYDGINWVASSEDITITGNIFANLTYSDTDGTHFGDVIADDSTTKLVDATLQKFTGSLVGDVTGDLKGSVFGDNSTRIIDAINNIVTANVVGNVTGDVQGSVFSDDSSPIIDGISGRISSPSISTRNLHGDSIDQIVELGRDPDGVYYNNIFRVNKTSGVALVINTVGDNDNAADIRGIKSRGGFTTPTTVQSGDRLLDFSAAGYDGSAVKESAAMAFLADGDPSIGPNIPGKARIRVIDATGSGIKEINLASDGVFSMSDVAKLNVLSSAPSAPVEGMIAIADGNTIGWDPKGTNSGVSYPAYYDTSGTWQPLV